MLGIGNAKAMVNRNPVSKFKKGDPRSPTSGRKPGTPNKTTQDLKEAILESASLLGYLKEVPVVDEKGKPTGKVDLVHDGEGGMTGYLVWLGKNNPAAYAPLLARVAALRARRIDPDVLQR
jgi:hypothetical protein